MLLHLISKTLWHRRLAGVKRVWEHPLVLILLALSATIFPNAGCVERTISISTEPEGATVYLNDEEVGRSPIKVPFTWYGDYDVIIRKPGFKTLKTNHRLHAPWYQTPVIDLFAECLVPYTIHDDRALPIYALEPESPPDRSTLLQSAQELRGQALGG